MSNELMIGLLSLTGTLFGSIAGILTANKLVMFRIEQLEKKVEKHNNLVERMTAVEQSLKSAHHRIDDVQGGGNKS
ncbi:MAG: hypothetical protein RR387_08375 [Clostridiales bacterium]